MAEFYVGPSRVVNRSISTTGLRWLDQRFSSDPTAATSCDALPENQRSYSQAEGISTATSPQVLLSAARSSPVVQ